VVGSGPNRSPVAFLVGRRRDGLEREVVVEFDELEGRRGACGEETCDEGGTDEQHAGGDEAADLEAVEERSACRMKQRVAGGTELV